MPMYQGLRIKIAEQWTASEFSELLSQLEFLYNVAQLSDVEFVRRFTRPYILRRRRVRSSASTYDSYMSAKFYRYEESQLTRFNLQNMVTELLPSELHELAIRRISYASPGFVDLAGLGKAIEQLRLFVLDIVDRYLYRDDRKIARESATQDVLTKKIKNAETLLNLSNKAGMDRETQQMLVREVLTVDDFLESKVISRKITSVGHNSD